MTSNFRNLIFATILISGCATQKPVTTAHLKTKNVKMLRGVAVGADKSEILRTFGAPVKIEIENKRFKYTYFDSATSKVIIHFDDKNKVASITK